MRVIRKYKKQVEDHHKVMLYETKDISEFAMLHKDTLIENAYLSYKLRHLLYDYAPSLSADINRIKISKLAKVSMSKFLKMKGAGVKVLEELKEVCFYAGVDLLP